MKNYLLVPFIMLATINVFAQTGSFDVFTYLPPAFFTKCELPTSVQFSLTNNDTSFCTITLYKTCRQNPMS